MIGFSPIPSDDFIHSALHVRHCFRELAGMLFAALPFVAISVGQLSMFPWYATVNGRYLTPHLDSNAFFCHSESLFQGVRVQIAKRCWTKDLEDATACAFNGDINLTQYTGGYGSAVTAPLTDEEEETEIHNAKRVISTRCANARCGKQVSSARYVTITCNQPTYNITPYTITPYTNP